MNRRVAVVIAAIFTLIVAVAIARASSGSISGAGSSRVIYVREHFRVNVEDVGTTWCPSGYSATGGGFSSRWARASYGIPFHLQETYPVRSADGLSGWRVRLYNQGAPAGATYTVHTACVR